MVSFKRRSSQAELMDEQDIPSSLLHKNLGELDILNRYMGGHAISMEGIKQLIVDKQKVYHLADFGCGSGDVLKYIARWARTNSYKVRLTGVDKNPDAIDYLNSNCAAYPEIRGMVSDYKNFIKEGHEIDIVHCALFCHHLNSKELIELFRTLNQYSRLGFVINDLHRSPIAYYSVWIMTRLLNGSALSKHDGPVSVLRAFTHSDLRDLLQSAGIKKYLIQWRWAFRYLVVAKTDGHGN